MCYACGTPLCVWWVGGPISNKLQALFGTPRVVWVGGPEGDKRGGFTDMTTIPPTL